MAPLVDSATSSLGQVIANKQIIDLPLNGRNPFALGLLSGNTTPMFGMGSNLPFIAGGGRFSANEVTLDGVDNNTVSNAGSIGRNGIAVVPSVDAVQEFKVKTSTFSAEFGHAAGAVINATIKSGTNQFHGNGVRVPAQQRSRRQQFLHQRGRPAARAFPSEPVRRRGRWTCRSTTGPSFSPTTRARGRVTADRQLHHRRPARGTSHRRFLQREDRHLRSRDPPHRTRPAWSSPIRFTGQHNSPEPAECRPPPPSPAWFRIPNFGAAGALARNFFYQPASFSNTDQGDVRVDQTLSAKNNLYGRFSISENSKPAVGTFPGFIGGGTSSIDDAVQGVLSDIHIFSPALVNEFRFGYVRHNGSIQGTGQDGAASPSSTTWHCSPLRFSAFPTSCSTIRDSFRALRSSRAGQAEIPTSTSRTAFNGPTI